MKRSLIVVPVILLLLLNACIDGYPPITNEIGTAVAQTQTATMVTPTNTPTAKPKESKIVDWMNEELLKTDALERSLDATYYVGDVSFWASNGVSIIMRVDVHCECSTNNGCCHPERTLIKAIESMRQQKDKIFNEVPGTVSELHIYCYDHLAQYGIMGASWSDVRNYLDNNINGYQFASRVRRR